MSLLRYLASNRFSRYFKLLLIFWDIILLNFAFLMAFMLRFGDFNHFLAQETKTVWLFLNLVWSFLIIYYEAYALNRIQRIENLIAKTFKLMLLLLGLVSLFLFLLDYSEVSRLLVLYFVIVFYSLVLVFRIFYLRMLKYLRSKGYNYRNVIIVCANTDGMKIGEIILSDLSYGFKLLGYFSDNKNDINKLLGKVNDVQNYLPHHHVHEMYVTLGVGDADKIKYLIELADKYMVRIKFVPDFHHYTKARKLNIDFYENTPVLTLRKEPLERPTNRLLKKVFDIVFSLSIIIFVFSWLFPILIVLVKMSSPGPVFFKQKRTGENKKSFFCLKFRSMRINGLADHLQASTNDPRVTKIGAFMRKTNLDELPQFFNVLWGDMSVVGPRPHMIKHTEDYSALINNYLVRHFAKPGITGWAQVNGFRGETKKLKDMEKRVEYDIWYIENWSFLLDLKIIFKTITNIFKGEENAR